MVKYISLLLLIVFQTAPAFSENNNLKLENSLGQLILLHSKKFSYEDDLNPFGSAQIYEEFLQLYETKIKTLPETERINYFWGSMWHLDFDGHYMAEFQALVMNDCGEGFIKKLEDYLEKERELQRYKSRLYLSERVLSGLRLLKDK